MEKPELRQRKPEAFGSEEGNVKDDDKTAKPVPHLKHGIPMQILRSLLIATWFNCCSVTIVLTQVIGSPLYFMNKKWYYNYMALTKESFGLVITALTQWGCPTLVRVSGDKSMRGQLHLAKDGRLRADFPKRIVLIANHQLYTDWVYLWWFAYSNLMHGRIFIILKESLRYIPIIGQGMMFYGFIFMARKWTSDKPRLQHRLEKLKTSHIPGSAECDPMWLLIFPEGTNLSENTKNRSKDFADKQGFYSLEHVLWPRSTGLFFCLQQLNGTVDWVYDCTLAYEGPPRGSYPADYFSLRSTYLQGRPPTSVNMHWRRFAVSEIPLDDQKAFDSWLRERWAEKEQLMNEYFEKRQFPSDLVGTIDAAEVSSKRQKLAASVGFVETHVRLSHWTEIVRIFMVLLGLALLCKLPEILRFFWR